MKVFITVDMEGISSLSSWAEKQEKIEEFMTKEVGAVVNGIKEGCEEKKIKIEEILVCDSHSRGMNIKIEALPEEVSVVRGFPRTFYMVEGYERGYDFAIFLGYHAPVGSINAPMDHTYSGSSFYEIKINGEIVGESEINAALLATKNIPVALISGDKALYEFSHSKFNDTQFVVTKEGKGKFSSLNFHPQKVFKELKEKAKNIITSEKYGTLFNRFNKPFSVEIQTTDTYKADLISIIPDTERKAGRTIFYETDDYSNVYRFIFSSALIAALKPD